MPHCLPLLQGQLGDWLAGQLGLPGLLPSVRCGLEGALLSALSAARRVSLAELLCSQGELPSALHAGVRLNRWCRKSPGSCHYSYKCCPIAC